MKVLTRVLVFLGLISKPNVRSFQVITSNMGNMGFEASPVTKVPPNVPQLYRAAQLHGYEGKKEYDSIVTYLKENDIDHLLEGTVWILFSRRKAPEQVLVYAKEHGYKGEGDCRSVGNHLRKMGMTPVPHKNGHWSIESEPYFG